MTLHQPSDPIARIQVRPRYLAGTTMAGYADILDTLVGTHGWSGTDDPDANYYATSPCHRFRLGFMPELRSEPIVQITAATAPMRSPQWHIAFDEHTPQELISAVTDDLADAIRSNAGLTLQPADGTTQPPAIALAPGWSTWTGASNTMHLAPDALASVIIHRPPHPGEPVELQETWAFRGGIGEHAWHAAFSFHTPHRLVHAFHQAVTGSSALLREFDEIPRAHLSHIRTQQPDPPRQGAAQQRSAMEPQASPARASTAATPAPCPERHACRRP